MSEHHAVSEVTRATVLRPTPACGTCGVALPDRRELVQAWRLHEVFGGEERPGWFCVPCAERLKLDWRQKNIVALLTRSRVPKQHHLATLAVLPREMARQLEGWRAAGGNLIITGPVGAGKSFSLAAIARDMLLAGRSVEWWSASELVGAARNFQAWDEDTLPRVCEADTLIIDDIGSEKGTDFAISTLADIVARRWDDCKATAVTTNLDPRALKAWHPRAASRLLSGTRVELAGRDRRLARNPGGGG